MAAVASRYARAFADAVFALKLDPDTSIEQLRAVVAIVSQSADLRRVWESPAIPAEQKRAVLDAIVARLGISKPVRNFMAVLIDHRRVVMLGAIVQQVELELHRRMGLADARITSARELTPGEKQLLVARIERMIGQRVQASYAIDRHLLGGAVVRLGSTIYDGSVRGQLHKIREELSAG